MRDPLADSPWSAPATVAGFVKSPPNARLMSFADAELRQLGGRGRLLDLGSGAGRNAVALAELGWDVVAVDLSVPMIAAAADRSRAEGLTHRLHLLLAPVDRLPVASGAFDLVVAHGIWNLARSGVEFREAVREAARASKPGAGLFVFTFSRNTLPASPQPVTAEQFVFTQFSGQPQCFLTADQLRAELSVAGFEPDPAQPLLEHNQPKPGVVTVGRGPVIYEGIWRRR